MDYKTIIDSIKKYGSDDRDICLFGIGVAPEQINENVIIAPWWEPSMLPLLGDAEYISASEHAEIKVWNIPGKSGNDTVRDLSSDITFIKTGIGAPVLMDVMLALGVTPCKNAIFVGAVGALDEKMHIGDIVIPEYSLAGDGASRYIASDSLKSGDVFGEASYPDEKLYTQLLQNARSICDENGVALHIGRTYSTDTIFAEYAHIDEIKAMGCNVIEMETSAAFRAAKMAGFSLAALFSVSDNTFTDQTLYKKIPEEETAYRRFARNTLFPQIIRQTFRGSKNTTVPFRCDVE